MEQKQKIWSIKNLAYWFRDNQLLIKISTIGKKAKSYFLLIFLFVKFCLEVWAFLFPWPFLRLFCLQSWPFNWRSRCISHFSCFTSETRNKASNDKLIKTWSFWFQINFLILRFMAVCVYFNNLLFYL